MDSKRLANEYENLIKSINRSRLAAEEIKLEKTEDEGDLAMISHETDLIYNLHEGGFARLRSIQEAMKAIDRGRYGECVRCRNEINEKRLMAILGRRYAFGARKKWRRNRLLRAWCPRDWMGKRRSSSRRRSRDLCRPRIFRYRAGPLCCNSASTIAVLSATDSVAGGPKVIRILGWLLLAFC
jgi:RNA polymerase-binding transcription factor DksA